MDVFTAAIVKGLIEHNDESMHFGSTLGIKEHIRCAIDQGYIESVGDYLQVTDKGKQLYSKLSMQLLPSGRAVYWDIPETMMPL